MVFTSLSTFYSNIKNLVSFFFFITFKITTGKVRKQTHSGKCQGLKWLLPLLENCGELLAKVLSIFWECLEVLVEQVVLQDIQGFSYLQLTAQTSHTQNTCNSRWNSDIVLLSCSAFKWCKKKKTPADSQCKCRVGPSSSVWPFVDFALLNFDHTLLP